jgi:biopolymer transport protein ExbB/TolQ
MYLQFTCTHCGKNLKVREENVGRSVRCPYCQQALTLQAPAETPSGLRSAGAHSVSTAEWSEGTNISAKKSAVLGLLIAVAFYGLVAFPFEPIYLGQLFLARGWVPYALTFLMGWSVAILYLKSKKLETQRDSMLFDLLPTQISDEITVRTVDQFTNYIRGLPVKPSESFLVNRVLRGLEHFRVLRTHSEVADRLESQSEIDATSVESSYTLLRVFIWALPILGFIGTIIGISQAVLGFSGSLDQAEDLAVLKQSLYDVTGGLALAFDTTLLALVMSMLVMFPASSLQKQEEDLLNWVDEYCNENLLKRLKDADRIAGEGSGVLVGAAPGSMQKSIEAAMAPHHAELRAWAKRLEAIGTTLTQQMVKSWTSVDQQLQAKHTAQVDQIKGVLSEVAQTQAASLPNIEATQKQAVELQRELLEAVRSMTAVLRQSTGNHQGPGDQVAVESGDTSRGGWSTFRPKTGSET